MNDGTVRVQKGWLADLEAEHAMWRESLRQIRAIHAPAEHDECGECELLWPCATAALAGFAERERADVNEELRRQIEARRDEELATIASVAAGAFGSSAAKRQYRAKHKATADALEWVLDLLAAQPAAVSLPEEAEPITVERLAAVIREVDGNHSLGAGALAEAILAALAPSPLPVVTAERQEALLTMLDGCEEAARIYEEQIAAIEANERAVDRWIAGAPAVSLELPEPPACDSCAVTLETLALWPCVIDGCREYVTVHVPGYPDCTNRCAAHHREVFDPDDQVAIALPSTEPPIEDAGSGGAEERLRIADFGTSGYLRVTPPDAGSGGVR